MQVNLKKTVVIRNGAKAKRVLMKVWKAGGLPPPRITTQELGVDTQWAALRCVGVYGAEIGGMSTSHMNDVHISAGKAWGKELACVEQTLELMAYGGPARDPQVTPDFNTVRISDDLAKTERRWRTFPTSCWHKEHRQVELPPDDDNVPACVKLHALLPAPRVPPVIYHEPARALPYWRHHCYYTDIQERAWLPLLGMKQSVYRAEFLAVVRALEERQPHETAKGWSRLCKPYKPEEDTPKDATGTLKRGPFSPCSLVRGSDG
eukprot:2271596-Amphidinium_carterae.1